MKPPHLFCQAEAFAALADEIHERNLDIVTFTGYTLEELREMAKTDKGVSDLLEKTDLLIDGPFINEEKDLTLQFRGSRNQRIIDIKKSLEMGETVWLEGVWQRRMGSGNIYE